MTRLPRYPVYVPSKTRWQDERALTVRFLARDRVPFVVVCEREEEKQYRSAVARLGIGEVAVLDESNRGLLYARNWIRDHAEATGAERHWQFDDNIGQMRRLYAGQRIPCEAGPAIAAVEDLTDRYDNVALSGFNYQMFVTPTSPPYRTNVHVYSATLVNHAAPFRWRLLYNDDTDICLQALAAGWTTILVNVFMVDKKTTMTVKGGNNDAEGPINYQGDGRLRMARALEEVWPGIATTDWRFGRPQHVVNWGAFTTPLRPVADLDALREQGPDEYGLRLRRRGEIAAAFLRRIADEYDGRWGRFPEDAPDAPNRVTRSQADTTAPQTSVVEPSRDFRFPEVPDANDAQDARMTLTETNDAQDAQVPQPRSAFRSPAPRIFDGVEYDREGWLLMRALAKEKRGDEMRVVHELYAELGARIVG